MPGSFVDTNVLVYIASNDPAKADRAEALLAGGATISVQVLNELANIARRKMQLTWAETTDFLATVKALLQVTALTLETHEAGLQLAERYSLSIYDAMIVAAALQAGCETLWSEDMQHGLQVQDRLQIRNPFR